MRTASRFLLQVGHRSGTEAVARTDREPEWDLLPVEVSVEPERQQREAVAEAAPQNRARVEFGFPVDRRTGRADPREDGVEVLRGDRDVRVVATAGAARGAVGQRKAP